MDYCFAPAQRAWNYRLARDVLKGKLLSTDDFFSWSLFYLTAYIHTLLYSFIDLFSTPLSLNLVGFCLLIPSLSTWFWPLLSFPYFQVKCCSSVSYFGGYPSSCFLKGDYCRRIHWIVFTNVMFYFHPLSLYYPILL